MSQGLNNRLEALSELMKGFPAAMKGAMERIVNEEDKDKILKATEEVERAMEKLNPKKSTSTNPNGPR